MRQPIEIQTEDQTHRTHHCFEFGITGGVICMAVSGSRMVFPLILRHPSTPGGYRKITCPPIYTLGVSGISHPHAKQTPDITLISRDFLGYMIGYSPVQVRAPSDLSGVSHIGVNTQPQKRELWDLHTTPTKILAEIVPYLLGR